MVFFDTYSLFFLIFPVQKIFLSPYINLYVPTYNQDIIHKAGQPGPGKPQVVIYILDMLGFISRYLLVSLSCKSHTSLYYFGIRQINFVFNLTSVIDKLI